MSGRFLAPALVLCLGLLLGSCSSFSGFVADHWPHWAGGMPSDVPPRPGTPGYNQFIAHGQADQDVLPPASGGSAPAVPVTPVFQAAPSAPAASAEPIRKPAPAAPPSAQLPPQSAAEDSSVVQGGLY